MSNFSLLVQDAKIRTDKATGYACITDIGNLKEAGGGQEFVRNWLRSPNTIAFIIAWERKHNLDFKPVTFDRFKNQAGLNSFRVSAGQLIEAGATGIITKRGRYGGTYCTPDWTIHFANWLDPDFYVDTIDSYRKMSEFFGGTDFLSLRFNRELAAKNYGLITQANDKRKIPTLPVPETRSHVKGDSKKTVRRHLKQVDADIINVAIWGLTAKQWSAKFPKLAKGRKNMRDYATTEELEVLSAIQIVMRQLQEDQYNPEEKLDRLKNKAEELTNFYCDTDQKLQKLVNARIARGW